MSVKTFISHSSSDEKFVLRLAEDLQNCGIDVWLGQWEINPGDKIPERIEQGLSEADVFILVLSPNSVNSPWVEYERQAWIMMQIEEEKDAKEESRPPRRRLIPLLYKDCQKPALLQPVSHISITDQDYKDKFKQLVSAILGFIAPTPAAPSPVAQGNRALTLLKALLPSQFDEVVFNYGMPHAYLSTNVPQVQNAIELIMYAKQRGEEGLSQLLDAIYSAAPHLKGGL